MTTFRIGDRFVGPNQPTYFIADIAANHDSNLERALELLGIRPQEAVMVGDWP